MSKGQSQMLKWFIIIMVFVLVGQGGYAGFRIMSGYPAYMTCLLYTSPSPRD